MSALLTTQARVTQGRQVCFALKTCANCCALLQIIHTCRTCRRPFTEATYTGTKRTSTVEQSCKTLALTCSCPLPFVAALGSWFHTFMISEHQSYWLVSVTSLHVRNHHQRLHTPRRPPGCRVCARSCTGPGRLYRAGGDVPATRANRKAGRTFTCLCFNVLARCW